MSPVKRNNEDLVGARGQRGGAGCVPRNPLAISPLAKQEMRYKAAEVPCFSRDTNQIKGFFVAASRGTRTFYKRERTIDAEGLDEGGRPWPRDKEISLAGCKELLTIS